MATIFTAKGLAATVLILAAMVPAAAPAQTQAPRDPNEKVCETVSQVGSRLSKKKICATRAEWAEMRRADREIIDNAQRSANIGCSIAPSLTNGPVPAC